MTYPIGMVYITSSAVYRWWTATSLLYLLVPIISTLAGSNQRTRSSILVPGAIITEPHNNHRTGSFIQALGPPKDYLQGALQHGHEPKAPDARHREQSMHKRLEVLSLSSTLQNDPHKGKNDKAPHRGQPSAGPDSGSSPVHLYEVDFQRKLKQTDKNDHHYLTRRGQRLDKAIASVLAARLRLRGNASLLLEQPERHREQPRIYPRSPPRGGSNRPDLHTNTQLTSGSERPHSTGKNTSWQYRYVTFDKFPDPEKKPRDCGRHHPSYLCDPYRLLTPKQAAGLDAGISLICSSTRCQCGDTCSKRCSGYKVAIAIIESSKELRRLRKSGGLEAWGNDLRNTWRFGGECGDDVLVVLAVNEKKLHLSVGRTAAKKLNAVCASAVHKDAQRTLQEGKITDTLSQLLRDIKLVFEDDFKCELSFISVMPTGKVIGIIFASVGPVILVVVILVFLGPCFRGRGFGGSSGSKHRSYYRRGYASSQVDMPWRNSSRNEEMPPVNQTTAF